VKASTGCHGVQSPCGDGPDGFHGIGEVHGEEEEGLTQRRRDAGGNGKRRISRAEHAEIAEGLNTDFADFAEELNHPFGCAQGRLRARSRLYQKSKCKMQSDNAKGKKLSEEDVIVEGEHEKEDSCLLALFSFPPSHVHTFSRSYAALPLGPMAVLDNCT
jgi:hypothetical protein